MKKGKRNAGWQDEEQNPSQKIEFDLEEDDSDGIIDLDDILEMDDEDQLDLDVEILDADADLDMDDFSTDLSDDDEDLLESDFLKDVSSTEDETLPVGLGEATSLDDEEVGDEEVEFESLLKMEMDEDEAARIALEMVGDDMQVDAPVLEASPDAGPGVSEALTSFVTQIEARLIDAVRQVVEEKLPEIVRSLLEEQIEKLKRELH
jgi:hypothetical protein